MSRNENDLERLHARVHELLSRDVLSASELALLPPSVAAIRGPRVHYRRVVLGHRIRRTALVVALLLGATVIVPPVSAAIARWLTAESAPAAPQPIAPREAPTEPAPLAQTEFTFAAETDRISVRFEDWQPGGTLTVGVAPGSLVVFRVDRIDAAPAVMVSPAGVRVQNQASTARYRLLLPANVRSLDVEVAGSRHVRLGRPEAVEVVVPLEQGSPTQTVPIPAGQTDSSGGETAASTGHDCPFAASLVS